jgi:hypothetical protein
MAPVPGQPGVGDGLLEIGPPGIVTDVVIAGHRPERDVERRVTRMRVREVVVEIGAVERDVTRVHDEVW